MDAALHVLLIEDIGEDPALIARTLSGGGFNPRLTRIGTEKAMREALISSKWDVIISDYLLKDFSCHRALEVLHESNLDIPFIVLSGSVSEDEIVITLRAGADDYVMNHNLLRLTFAVKRELRDASLRGQRRELEAQLQQARKMEAIGRLAGPVAHDFNNLLLVISGFAQLALLDDNPATAGLEQILLASEHAAQLTRQLLAFSQQQTLQPRVFDLSRLIGETEKMLSRLAGPQIELAFELSSEPVTVVADPSQIEQVVFNLVVNARDAMPEGGRLSVSTSRRYLDGAAARIQGLHDGEYSVVAVTDTGQGIPPEVLPHIFEPFFTTKPEGKGTGLGLATVYGVVQQSRGAVQVMSEQGLGTTITVFIPHSDLLPDPDKPSGRGPLGGGTETVLVSEADPEVLRIVFESLDACGYRVLRAGNGEKAIGIIQNKALFRVELLITDVSLPGISGPALAAKATEASPDLKVLFMSGFSDETIQHHGVAGRNADFIQKPFAPGDLVRKARRLLDRGAR